MLMMLPFEAPTVFEGIHKSYFRMPRIVKDQRSKFEKDDLFRQLSHESAVKYTGFKDRPLEERQMKFIANCQEGHTEVSVVQSGNQFTLMFNPTAHPAYNNEGCDFDKELGKVHIKSGFILNGVCVLWRGWLDLQRLEGFGCLEFDEYRAYLEEAMLKQQIDKQQAACNSALGGPASATNQPSPLNHHPSLNCSSAGGAPGPAPHLAGPLSSLMAAPSLAGSGGHLSPSCLQAASQAGLQHLTQPPAPPGALASLADSAAAAQYGNAAIAAAAAAFQQAFGVVGPPTNHPGLHGLTSAPSAAVAAAAAAVATGQPPLISSSQQHLGGGAYTNGNSNPLGSGGGGSPKQMSNGNTALIKEQHHQQHQRQATKRSLQDEQTHLDDVDVVSDMHLHHSDLDFPPRRMFKADPLAAAPLHHHHHHNSNHPSNHHHHHHRATRRA